VGFYNELNRENSAWDLKLVHDFPTCVGRSLCPSGHPKHLMKVASRGYAKVSPFSEAELGNDQKQET